MTDSITWNRKIPKLYFFNIWETWSALRQRITIWYIIKNYIFWKFSYLPDRHQYVLVLVWNHLLLTSSEITDCAHEQDIGNFKKGLQIIPIWECKWRNIWIFHSLYRLVTNQLLPALQGNPTYPFMTLVMDGAPYHGSR